MQKDFYINERFLVRPDANLLMDAEANKINKLEPRIMQLLCILAERQGKTVSREELVTLIWQDYGGGDESLNQSISVLRKILRDERKDLIKTISKKGYVLNASILYDLDQAATGNHPGATPTGFSPSAKRWIIGICALVIGLAIYFIFSDNSGKPASAPTQVPFPDTSKDASAEENELNTIVSRGPDSTVYKLVVIGDRPPKFFINNQEVPAGKWEPYAPLINSLKQQLKDKNRR